MMYPVYIYRVFSVNKVLQYVIKTRSISAVADPRDEIVLSTRL